MLARAVITPPTGTHLENKVRLGRPGEKRISRLIPPASLLTLLISSVLVAQQQADTSEPEPGFGDSVWENLRSGSAGWIGFSLR